MKVSVCIWAELPDFELGSAPIANGFGVMTGSGLVAVAGSMNVHRSADGPLFVSIHDDSSGALLAVSEFLVSEPAVLERQVIYTWSPLNLVP